MKPKKKIYLIMLSLMTALSGFAQKQTFDIVSYTPPKGWTEKQGDGNISYSKIDGGSWAQIASYQHRNSEGDIQTDFDKEWNELVAANKTISSSEKTQPQTAEGWTVMSGSGVWQYNGANVASVLTVYSNNSVCVSVLCNATAQPYLKEYQTLLGSLYLDAASVTVTPATENTDPTAAGANTSMNTGNTSITGLWIAYRGEEAGYMNGFRMTTGGYFRKEYLLKEDGTYIFRVKNWSAHMENIYFVYETGTYTVNGNQLTITPKQGKAGWWKKEGSRTDKWGSYLKAADYKLETVTYPFYTQHQESRENMLFILTNTNPVKRDGTIDINDNQTKKWVYGWGGTKSLIDNPPGFKTN